MVKFKVGDSGGFLYLAGADAGCANSNLLPHACHHRANALQVRIPPAPPRVVRVADHVSIMRRFAAELTLQCHFSSCFSFYLGLDFLLEMSPNQAPHSSRPATSGKVRLLRPGCFSGTRPFPTARFCGAVLNIRSRRTALSPLFFRTGFDRVPRTSNCSNRIEITRVVRKKNVRWPPVPLLAQRAQLNLPLSVRQSPRARATYERFNGRHLRDPSARCPSGAGR
jgi:hypothetical protein